MTEIYIQTYICYFFHYAIQSIDIRIVIASMDKFYTVYGPEPSINEDSHEQSWITKRVDCWWCMKSRSVTQDNRCYVPIRVQERIDGSFCSANETEDLMTRKFGYFDTWQCALAYCQVHFPNICYKVHDHAHRNGFVGMLAPATDPRFVTSRFNPYVPKQSTYSSEKLIPSAMTGIFMRRVPDHEQCTNKFRDANIVMENHSYKEKVAKEFPQCVVDSEQLLHSLSKTNELPYKEKTLSKRKPTKQSKPRKKKKINTTKHISVEKTSLDSTKATPKLTDFFGIDVVS